MDPTIDRLIEEAVALRRAGERNGASGCFEDALARDPHHPGALTSYAMLLLEMGDTARAIRLGRRAIVADPRRVSAHHVLGQALCRAGRLDDGIATLRRAVALRPDAFEARFHLGSALVQVRDLEAAEAQLRHADELAPETPAVLVALGNLYRLQHRPADAIAAYRRAIRLDPRLSTAHGNLGNVLSEIGDCESAIASFRQAVALAPDHAPSWSNLLLALDRSDRISGDELAAEHRRYGAHFGARRPPWPPARAKPLAGRCLKIGYVSSDFVNHAVAVFFEPLLAHHDRSRFEIHCFHNRNTSDAMTDRIRTLAEHFVRVADMSDGDLAQRIRREEIDILVDLNGHTAHNRLPLFLLKPAPIQVTWLGYLATTGLATIDYRLTDAHADPPGLTEGQHTEALWRLPDSLWCYRPYEGAPDVGPLPARANGRVTFASLNSPGKLSVTAVRLWTRILAASPSARMILITGAVGDARIAELQRLFTEQGIAPGRIEHLPPHSTLKYLELYNRVDIALDTWPYAGGTTTCDALWMGVPVVTLTGNRAFSRTGASVLRNAGLPELVTDTPDEYVETALNLARDRDALAALRASLRNRVRASALCEPVRFARAIETAFTAMARRSLPP